MCARVGKDKHGIQKKFDFVLTAVDDKENGGRIDIKDNVGGNLKTWFLELNFHCETQIKGEIRRTEIAWRTKPYKIMKCEIRKEIWYRFSLLTSN